MSSSSPPPPPAGADEAASSSSQSPSSSSEQAPLHVLMLLSSPDQAQEIMLRDPRIHNDYLARRQQQCHVAQPSSHPKKNKQKDGSLLWSAATRLERAMADCCELVTVPPENDDHSYLEHDEDDDEEDLYEGGALARGKEYAFCELLARHGHAPSARALALAILEHSIEQDELDAQEEEEEKDDNESRIDGMPSSSKEETSGDGEGTAEAGMDDAEEKGSADGHEDASQPEKEAAFDPDESSSRESSSGSGRQVQNNETTKVPRMHRFLEAGGLRLLQQWLVDAMTPRKNNATAATVSARATSPPIGANKPSVVVPKTKPSSTGPLLIPLLSVLEKMPMDKNLVTATRINKQIRNLKKQLDEAVRDRRPNPESFEHWRDFAAGGLAVVRVQKAVESLMETWKEQFKTSALETRDPFVELRAKMRERLHVLVQLEAGNMAEKPEWLVSFEVSERIAKEKKAISKMSTRQLEARERQQEREKVLKAMQDRQQEVKQKMSELLKKKEDLSRKRKTEQVDDSTRKKKTAKRVRWKDGFDNSDNLRKRKLLEDVYYYRSEYNKPQEESNEEDEQEQPTEDDIDDDFDMFADDEGTEGEAASAVDSSAGDDTNQSESVVVKQEPDL